MQKFRLNKMLNDIEIEHLIVTASMIDPFVAKQVTEVDGVKVISFGLSSFGYDIRIGSLFKVFSPIKATHIDPKNFNEDSLVEIKTDDYCLVPPNSYVLAHSIEHFVIPDNICADCIGKSSYARCGLIVNVTPLEPGWFGQLTIEISNATPLPVRLYAHEGVAQVRFYKGERPRVTYKQRKGKYQAQQGVIPARMK